MSRNVVENSILTEINAVYAAWLAMTKERLDEFARQGRLAVWAIRPVFDLVIAALIYAGGRKDLIPYIVVAMTANSLVWNSIFWIGEILDRERLKGTLMSLFMAPCSRLSWLIGFAGSGIVETAAGALTVGLGGMLLFGVRFHPNYVTLLVALSLFVASLVGIGLIMSGLGLITKRSNELCESWSPSPDSAWRRLLSDQPTSLVAPRYGSRAATWLRLSGTLGCRAKRCVNL